jgi:ABC-type bacteriocin/lantibiotic exporter with double-glycine peptidase domain
MPTDTKVTRQQLWALLKPESDFLWVAIVYGLAISLITLAVPIAVQTLINTIANIGSVRAVTILAIVLFIILSAGAALSALRLWVMELYQRKIFTRLTSDISLRLVMATHPFFEGRRNSGMTHRYFDVMTFQKNIPALMIDGFALVFQTIVGFTLVSFYHPWLFLFNIISALAVYAAWRIWSEGAKRSAIELSKEKYRMGRWLADLEAAHEFFKSSRHLSFAAQTTDDRAEYYINQHKAHFHFTFRQTLAFLTIYALGSAALLGLGGWLVVNNQLTIGQLVAAELIMAGVFLGFSRFGSFLKSYYELYGSADKLTELLGIPQETVDIATAVASAPESGALEISDLMLRRGNDEFRVNLSVDSGRKYFVKTNRAWLQRQLIHYIRYYDQPESGWISLGGLGLSDHNTYDLRQAIYTIDRSLIIECTIVEFLRLARPSASENEMKTVLERVNLWEVIANLPQGLRTRMSSMGAPLQAVEVLLLKLAAALLAKPKLVLLNQQFDALDETTRYRLFAELQDEPFTMLYFTSAPLDHCLDGVIAFNDTASAALPGEPS